MEETTLQKKKKLSPLAITVMLLIIIGSLYTIFSALYSEDIIDYPPGFIEFHLDEVEGK